MPHLGALNDSIRTFSHVGDPSGHPWYKQRTMGIYSEYLATKEPAMLRNRLLVACVVALISLSSYSYVAIKAQGRAAQAPVGALGGRFVMMAPPQASTTDKANFLWILDSQTGAIRAYRFVGLTKENGWGIEPLPLLPPAVDPK